MGRKAWPEAHHGGEDIVEVRKAERTIRVFRVFVAALVGTGIAAGAVFIPVVALAWIGGIILALGGSYLLGGAIGLGIYVSRRAAETLERAKRYGVSSG